MTCECQLNIEYLAQPMGLLQFCLIHDLFPYEFSFAFVQKCYFFSILSVSSVFLESFLLIFCANFERIKNILEQFKT